MTYISFLRLFCSFFSVYLHYLSAVIYIVRPNKYYYIQRRGVTLKSNRSRSLKMGPIDRSYYSRACVTITSSGGVFC